jgi:hypothetical protein
MQVKVEGALRSQSKNGVGMPAEETLKRASRGKGSQRRRKRCLTAGR